MEFIDKNGDNVIIKISPKERMMINNALNETCNGMKIPDFENRVGFPKELVRALLAEIYPENLDLTKIIDGNENDIQISLTQNKMLMIANAFHETCKGISVRAFHARTGVYLEEMQSLLAEFLKLQKNLEEK